MVEWRGEILQRLSGARLDAASEAEIVEELSQHLDDRFAELRRSGVPEADAREQVLAELESSDVDIRAAGQESRSGLAAVLSSVRGSARVPEDHAGSGFLSGMRGDIRYAVRSLRRTPGYTAVVTLTLALGIGAASAAQAVIDPLLLRPLGFGQPDRLVTLTTGVMPGEFLIIQEHTTTFAALSLVHPGRAYAIAGDDEPFRVVGAAVTPDFFSTLGVTPLLGRLPDASSETTAMLSHRLWQTRFGGARDVAGSTLRVEGRSVVVAGVMPPSFDFPTRTELWLAAPLNPANVGSIWGIGGFQLVGRLAPGAEAAVAETEIRRLSGAMSAANPFWTPPAAYREDVGVITIHEALVGDVRRSLLLLGASVLLLLLIACANVANLVLARGLGRARELAVRTALGASSGRIVRQLITETLVLAAAGGTAGIALAYLATHALSGLLPAGLPRLVEVGVDLRVLLASIALTLCTGLILGVLPARRATRFDVQESLREGARSMGGRSGRRLSGTLVVVQVALAVLLVTGAGLLVRSLAALQRIDTGIGHLDVVTARVDLPTASYEQPALRGAFYEQLLTRAAALPGMRGIAATSQLPFSGHLELSAMLVEHVTPDPNNLPVFIFRRVSPQLFDALGVTLRQGRLLTDADAAPGALPVAVIDETTAREFWPGESPLGRRLGRPWMNEMLTVVGVVDAVLDGQLAGTAERTVYVPLAKDPPQRAFLVINSAAGMGSIPALRSVLRDIDPTVPLSDVGTMSGLISGTLTAQRLATTLLGGFGLLALALAAIGIYGVLAYAVGQRVREMSLRLALGARAGEVLGMVLREGMALAAAGAIIGILAALALGRVLHGLLYGVSPHDPITLALVALVVLAAAAVAVLVPAVRASRAAPMDALRT
jgi:putative ABC transport system permease protein